MPRQWVAKDMEEVTMEQETQPSTDQVVEQEPIVTTSNRLMEVYDQVAESDDIAYKTASFLTVTNYYSFALRISNSLNDRQGRNRLSVQTDDIQLMKYSMEVDVDDILDKNLTEMLVHILNVYLADKFELPQSKPKVAQGKINRVKALMIMLVSTNQYGLIPSLNVPPYMLSYNIKLFDNIQEIRESVLRSWIDYLIKSGNPEMAERVRQVGNEFWGSDGVKANVIWDRYFGDIEHINNQNEVYQAYLEFRAEYRKSTKSILPSKMYDIYDITPGQYDNARRNIYAELQELFPEYLEQIRRLVYEQ